MTNSVTRIKHDRMCPVCEYGHAHECTCTCFCDFISDIRDDERQLMIEEMQQSGRIPTPNEEHDPMCPRADMEQAWNGAECHCGVIKVLRRVEGVTIERADFDKMWHKIDAQVSRNKSGWGTQ